MRPKIVILILGIGVGLVAVVVLLKGLTGGRVGNAGGQTAAVEAGVGLPSATNGRVVQDGQVNLNSTNNVAISEQMRAAAVEKELDAIRELQGEADGENNPRIISALLKKGSSPDAEVRKAVVESLRQMNDTNAIPGLQKLMESIQDPREKVAVMNTIDYLNLPNAMPDVQPPESFTNISDTATFTPPVKMNPNFLHKAGRNGRQPAPPNAPAGQAQ